MEKLSDLSNVIENYVREKEVFISQETGLIADLNKALEKLGYQVTPVRKQGRPVGYSPKGKKNKPIAT